MKTLAILGIILLLSINGLQAGLTVVGLNNATHISNEEEVYDIDVNDIEQEAKRLISLLLLIVLKIELEDNPNIIEIVAKDNNIDIDINAMLENSKQLLEKLDVISTETTSMTANDEYQQNIVSDLYRLAVIKECLNYGIDLERAIETEADSDLQYVLLIECLLAAYTTGLLAAAEEEYAILLAKQEQQLLKSNVL